MDVAVDDDVVVLEGVRVVVVADVAVDVAVVAAAGEAAVGVLATPGTRVATRSVVVAEVADTPA